LQVGGGGVVEGEVAADEEVGGGEVELAGDVGREGWFERDVEVLARVGVFEAEDGVAGGDELGEAAVEGVAFFEGDFPDDGFGLPAVDEGVAEEVELAVIGVGVGVGAAGPGFEVGGGEFEDAEAEVFCVKEV